MTPGAAHRVRRLAPLLAADARAGRPGDRGGEHHLQARPPHPPLPHPPHHVAPSRPAARYGRCACAAPRTGLNSCLTSSLTRGGAPRWMKNPHATAEMFDALKQNQVRGGPVVGSAARRARARRVPRRRGRETASARSHPAIRRSCRKRPLSKFAKSAAAH